MYYLRFLINEIYKKQILLQTFNQTMCGFDVKLEICKVESHPKQFEWNKKIPSKARYITDHPNRKFNNKGNVRLEILISSFSKTMFCILNILLLLIVIFGEQVKYPTCKFWTIKHTDTSSCKSFSSSKMHYFGRFIEFSNKYFSTSLNLKSSNAGK